MFSMVHWTKTIFFFGAGLLVCGTISTTDKIKCYVYHPGFHPSFSKSSCSEKRTKKNSKLPSFDSNARFSVLRIYITASVRHSRVFRHQRHSSQCQDCLRFCPSFCVSLLTRSNFEAVGLHISTIPPTFFEKNCHAKYEEMFQNRKRKKLRMNFIPKKFLWFFFETLFYGTFISFFLLKLE